MVPTLLVITATFARPSSMYRSPVTKRTGGPRASGSALVVLGGTLARAAEARPKGKGWVQSGEAWVQLPQSTPWAVVHFVGGAGFGSAPQFVYDELLTTIVQRCGVAVIATPYDVAFNHRQLAAATQDAFERAREECQTLYGLSTSAPTYRLGHSLGAKLLLLSTLRAERARLGAVSSSKEEAAERGARAAIPTAAPPLDSLGLIAYNNFGLSDSAALAASFISAAQGGDRGAATARAVLNAFGFVQQMASVTGTAVDVTPTPTELDAEVATWFGAASPTPPLTLLRFEFDDLDSSDRLLDALPPEVAQGVRVTRLPGGHLAPVFFRLDPADIDPALALLLGGAMGSGGFAVGSSEALEPLCEAVCAWIWPGAKAPPPLLTARADESE